MAEKYKLQSGSIQETLLLPLWGRAYESQRANPRMKDPKAVEIIDRIDYDFPEPSWLQGLAQNGAIARLMYIDDMIRRFTAEHPRGTIVNIGCGLDTTFYRVDNGQQMFYELDLPDVIEIRRALFEPDTERHVSIATSFLDTAYFEKIRVEDGLLFTACGVLMYFSEAQIKGFFIEATDYFKRCEFYFDVVSPLGLKTIKRSIIKQSGMDTIIPEGWGVKDAHAIAQWDSRFRVREYTRMYRDIRRGLPFLERSILALSDRLNVGGMVHLQAGEEQ
ncbi:MAG: tetracenomycin C synthesis protein [Bacteroidetes bacterium]|nr:MAG: tetracenomycin C synthesis protein [Bacteroidota bacterium]